MEDLKKYIHEILGETIYIEKLTRNKLRNIPIYIHLSYNIYRATILNNDILLIENKDVEDFKILQTDKHIRVLKDAFNIPVVLVLSELASYNRLRLIEKRINFIVAGKQLYIPALLMDFRESFIPKKKHNKETLTPSAQMVVLYHMLNRDVCMNLENLSFREIAKRIGYTPMAISKAVDNLKQLGLIEVEGFKEKRISFIYERRDLWINIIENNFYCNPVLKRVYVDKIPNHIRLLRSNESALSEYSDMNPSRQMFFAIEKNAYYALQKSKGLVNENKYYGEYCLEVWKYNPQTLVDIFDEDRDVVDPLSLFCTLMHDKDERIQMALEQIEDKYAW